MKKTKRFTVILLAAALIAVAGISAYAVNEEASSPKEEVVYAKLDGSGDVSGIYVVNIFSGGDIVDYGDYSEVKTLNTDDTIEQQGDKITLAGTGDKVYYEGTLNSHNLPWDITIDYTLNGEKITAEELAEKSGDLEIDLDFRQNINCDSSFFDRYALQTTMTLDTEKCENITAANATIANVGQKKQLTYILLPGREQHITVTADVRNFEMEGISINGIRMDLAIDIDNNELMSKVQQIENAAASLDDGAAAVANGAVQIDAGAQTLNENAYTIAAGGANLAAGVDTLCNGLSLAQSGLEQLNNGGKELTGGSAEINRAIKTIDKSLQEVSTSATTVKELIDASSAINSSLKQLSSSLNHLEQGTGAGIDLSGAKSANQSAITTINSDIATIQGMMADLKGMEAQIRAAGYGDTYDTYISEMQGVLSDLSALKSTANTNITALNGAEQYIGGIHAKTKELSDGAAALSAKYDTFNTEIIKLASVLTSMIDDMEQMKTAIHTLCSAYDNFDGNLQKYTEGVTKLTAGFETSAGSLELLSTGSKDLAVYLNALSQGSDTLANYTTVLADGSETLAAGTAAFRNATDGMDQQVQREIDQMIDSLTGGDGKTLSFVSDKNTSVTALQFVISTDPIHVEEDEN